MSHRATAFTAEHLLKRLRSFPVANAYVVGFSGGADSTALLHALSTIQHQLGVPVSAVHVNHGLHEDADLWQLRCEGFCKRYKINLVCLRVKPENRSGKGLEAEARHLRYEAISALLKPGACLLTAHHADDQAETLLLNLLRGSGVDGLSAMPESRQLGNGLLQRPMLEFQNIALRNYLAENNIDWTEDPSNQYLDHDRNFVRHEVIPLLEKRWPQVSKRLLLTRKAMSDARHLLENLADDNLGPTLSHPQVLQITPELLDNLELLKLVIRRWIKKSGTPSIPAYRLETFCRQVQCAGSDHNISVSWDSCVVRLYKQQLWFQRDKDINLFARLNWPVGVTRIDLGKDAGHLQLSENTETVQFFEDGSQVQALPEGKFSVDTRCNLKECVISQGGIHKNLKNLFQAADIPPWFRDYIPLCILDGEVVAMGDWCFSEQFASWLSENNLVLSWHPRHPLLQFIRGIQH